MSLPQKVPHDRLHTSRNVTCTAVPEEGKASEEVKQYVLQLSHDDFKTFKAWKANKDSPSKQRKRTSGSFKYEDRSSRSPPPVPYERSTPQNRRKSPSRGDSSARYDGRDEDNSPRRDAPRTSEIMRRPRSRQSHRAEDSLSRKDISTSKFESAKRTDDPMMDGPYRSNSQRSSGYDGSTSLTFTVKTIERTQSPKKYSSNIKRSDTFTKEISTGDVTSPMVFEESTKSQDEKRYSPTTSPSRSPQRFGLIPERIKDDWSGKCTGAYKKKSGRSPQSKSTFSEKKRHTQKEHRRHSSKIEKLSSDSDDNEVAQTFQIPKSTETTIYYSKTSQKRKCEHPEVQKSYTPEIYEKITPGTSSGGRAQGTSTRKLYYSKEKVDEKKTPRDNSERNEKSQSARRTRDQSPPIASYYMAYDYEEKSSPKRTPSSGRSPCKNQDPSRTPRAEMFQGARSHKAYTSGGKSDDKPSPRKSSARRNEKQQGNKEDQSVLLAQFRETKSHTPSNEDYPCQKCTSKNSKNEEVKLTKDEVMAGSAKEQGKPGVHSTQNLTASLSEKKRRQEKKTSDKGQETNKSKDGRRQGKILKPELIITQDEDVRRERVRHLNYKLRYDKLEMKFSIRVYDSSSDNSDSD